MRGTSEPRYDFTPEAPIQDFHVQLIQHLQDPIVREISRFRRNPEPVQTIEVLSFRLQESGQNGNKVFLFKLQLNRREDDVWFVRTFDSPSTQIYVQAVEGPHNLYDPLLEFDESGPAIVPYGPPSSGQFGPIPQPYVAPGIRPSFPRPGGGPPGPFQGGPQSGPYRGPQTLRGPPSPNN